MGICRIMKSEFVNLFIDPFAMLLFLSLDLSLMDPHAEPTESGSKYADLLLQLLITPTRRDDPRRARILGRLLTTAASRGHVGLCELFVSRGASCNAACKKGVTPLHAAAHKGQLGACKFLLERGAAVESRDANGRTPVHYATLGGHADVCEQLLAACAAAADIGDVLGETALHIATHAENAHLCRALLEGGASQVRAADGWTPLFVAAMYGSGDICSLMVSRDRSAQYVKDEDGRTPFDIARLHESVDVLRILAEAQAQDQAQDQAQSDLEPASCGQEKKTRRRRRVCSEQEQEQEKQVGRPGLRPRLHAKVVV